jgi:acyl-CoA thioester hydrolase
VLFTVVELAIQYRRPARLDDLLRIVTGGELSGAAVQFRQVAQDEAGSVLAEAQIRVACVDARTFRPRRLPAWLTQQESS